MKRRDLLGAGLALTGAALAPAAAKAAAVSRVRPGGPGWPSDADWAGLNRATGGRLSPVTVPDLTGPDAKKLLANPFYVADQPGLSQSSGWLDAWRSSPSAYVVAAQNTADVVAAVRGADAIYTDVCTSMGFEHEVTKRAPIFKPYQVNEALMAHAAPHAVFMHCLPAHRNAEVTDAVLDGPQSVVFDQAENRLHAQKALMVLLLGGGLNGARTN